MQPRALPLEKGVNFRDLGGYVTKDGRRLKTNKVIRSASLGNLSTKDLEFLEDYGLRYDIDFRSAEETKAAPDRLPDETKYFFAPVFPEDETKSSQKDRRKETFFTDPQAGFDNMVQAYQHIVLADSAKKAYRQFFDVLLANEKEGQSVLFHCSAGKDRTGMGAVYLLSLLGMSDELILNDYLASNHFLAPWHKEQLKKHQLAGETTQIFLDNMRALGSVDPLYLQTALDIMQREYGSLGDYLRHELQVTPTQVKQLQAIYLEEI